MYLQNKGYSLVEVMIAVGIAGILTLAGGSLLTTIIEKQKTIQTSADTDGDLSISSKYLDSDLESAGINLNTTHILDANGNEFFEYLPFSPSVGSRTTGSREIILSLDTIKYKNPFSEIVFLVTDRKWSFPLVFSPRKAYLTGSSCTEGTSLKYNGFCLFEKNITIEAIKEFGKKIMENTADAFYFFQIPEYYKKPIPSQSALNTKLISYTFLAAPNANTQSSVSENNIDISTVNSTSSTEVQSNKFTVIKSVHPDGVTNPNTLDTYLTKIPFYSGTGTAFNLYKVRLIKYMVEKRTINGKDTLGLYRAELVRNSSKSFTAKNINLIGEGFEALTLKRKFVDDPLISIKFDRQFKLTGSTKGN